MNDSPPLIPMPIIALHYLTPRQGILFHMLCMKVEPPDSILLDDPDLRLAKNTFWEIAEEQRIQHIVTVQGSSCAIGEA
ncbi:MAG: hypothetical protein ACE5JU_19860 [Candidatus Binatia bacterium]